MKNNRIDIIIPVYKAHDTILRALSSVISQTILVDIDVTIVNDCCPEGDYKQYIDMFSTFMSIKEIILPKNCGASIARQYGIDHTNNEFIVFLDADDAFNGSCAIEILRARIKSNPSFQCCASYFNEVMDSGNRIIMHQQDMTWLFGKIYRRDFLDKYHIRFIDKRASNQDVGFNTLVKLYCNNEYEQICFSDDCTYTWIFNPNSVTTIGNFQFEYDQSICGFVDNMIYVCDHINHHSNMNLSEWVLYILIVLYCKLNMIIDQCPIFEEQCWYYIKKFYHYSYLDNYKGLEKGTWKLIVFNTINDQNTNPSMENVIPYFTVFQFMQKLNSENFDEKEISEIQNRIPNKYKKNNIACGIVSNE